MNDETRHQATEKVRAVKQVYEQVLLAKQHVVGVGVGLRQQGGEVTDTVALVVMVDHKVPEAALDPEDRIPAEIEGVPVDVQEVGQVRAL